MAARGSRAATSDTCHRISRFPARRGGGEPAARISPGLERGRYIEGENLAILYRWADDRLDRLPLLAAELVSRSVAAIVTSGQPSVLAAKAATTTIPIIFVLGVDPVQLGLAASLSRPDRNLTGIDAVTAQIGAKRLEVLHDLLPKVTRIGVLVNPADAGTTEAQLTDIEAAARTMGLQIKVYNADTSAEINAAFEAMGRDRPDALFAGTSVFLNGRRVQLAQLAAFYRLPAI